MAERFISDLLLLLLGKAGKGEIDGIIVETNHVPEIVVHLRLKKVGHNLFSFLLWKTADDKPTMEYNHCGVHCSVLEHRKLVSILQNHSVGSYLYMYIRSELLDRLILGIHFKTN